MKYLKTYKIFEGIVKTPTIKLAEYINKQLDGLAYICLSDGYKQVRMSDDMEIWEMVQENDWEDLFINVCDEHHEIWFDFELNDFTPDKIREECNKILDDEYNPNDEDVDMMAHQIATEMLIIIQDF